MDGGGRFEPLRGLGLVHVELPASRDDPAAPFRGPAAGGPVFVRDVIVERGRIDALPQKDRLGALLEAVDEHPPGRPWGEVMIHVPEGAKDADLPRFARKWTAPVAAALRRRGWLTAERRSQARRLDLLLPDFGRLIIGESRPGHRCAFPGGRPRLRLPSRAPSRSVLKIEEAFSTLLTDSEREELLAPGMTAVDLGAAPGGWTFHLVRLGLRVIAVDNGPMDERLLQSGWVEHLRTDGFTWLPDRPCDWMVCDIVDKPRRTIDLAGRWFRGGHCRAAVFNLKLPMKKRLEEWYLCRDRLEAALKTTRRAHQIRAKQLYHDREEVTVLVLPHQ